MHNYNHLGRVGQAAAIGYDQKNDQAPKLLAGGHGIFANKIIELAKEHNVPIYQNAELADILLALEIGEHIPPEIYAVMAEILMHIYAQNPK